MARLRMVGEARLARAFAASNEVLLNSDYSRTLTYTCLVATGKCCACQFDRWFKFQIPNSHFVRRTKPEKKRTKNKEKFFENLRLFAVH